MVWKPRLSGKQLYHHIYAWGNDRHPVFKDDRHYREYLEYLQIYLSNYGLDIIAYALMEWHVHLFVFDPFDKISEFMKSLHGKYARFYNRDVRRVGHVFGERFNNKVVQVNNYGLWLSRYIHRQAVEAGIVNDPKDYSWTSYQVYIGLASKGFLKPGVILEQFGRGQAAFRHYREFVIDEEDSPIDWDKTITSIIGDKDFVKDVEVSNEIDQKEDELSNQNLIEIVSSKLHVKPKLLLNPRGWSERRLRHEAFVILVNKYGLSARKVAQVFTVSPTAVVKALKKARAKV